MTSFSCDQRSLSLYILYKTRKNGPYRTRENLQYQKTADSILLSYMYGDMNLVEEFQMKIMREHYCKGFTYINVV